MKHEEIRELVLQDQTREFLSNELIGSSISIPRPFWDELVSCHVVFPNGIVYEAFPEDRIPPGPISFMQAVQPFVGCSIGFLNADVSFSGTYELMSLLRHSADNSLSLTRQRFHVTLIPHDPTK
ncbi:hypothetical protein HW555_001672 [Spodoptera exigua]|uniref:Uncharacterized protein n=1 Tax=Spodoptera exigua TaxID=7107 RepID=A0A835LF30_SPOEX|nr:hypothetical protein HW555_001672 [Spodoptera exigua]